jgi:hypothetical protein
MRTSFFVRAAHIAALLVVVDHLQAQTPATGSKVWLGRYAEFEAFILSAPIERFEETKVGVTRPKHAFFTPGGLAAGATVKVLPPRRQGGYFESYKAEIAAYKLDRLLQLDMVPPTVERRVGDDIASIQLWVEGTRTIKEVQRLKEHAPDSAHWNRQVYRQRVFDNLVANIDENAGNLLIDGAWNIIKVDHSRCFATDKMPFELTRIDRDLFQRLQALDEAAVTREVGNLIDADGVGGVMKRRAEIVKKFQSLIAKNGEARVLIP